MKERASCGFWIGLASTLALFLPTVGSLVAQTSGNPSCAPWVCEAPGRIDHAGSLQDPGPVKVCTGSPASLPVVTGTSITPARTSRVCSEGVPTPVDATGEKSWQEVGSLTYQPQVLTTPVLPSTFDTAGTTTYAVSVKGIPSDAACPTLGPADVGSYTVVVTGKCKENFDFGQSIGTLTLEYDDLAKAAFDRIKAATNGLPYLRVENEKVSLSVSGEVKRDCCNPEACEDTVVKKSGKAQGSGTFDLVLSAFPQPPRFYWAFGSLRVLFEAHYGPRLNVTPSVTLGGSYEELPDPCRKKCLELSIQAALDIRIWVGGSLKAIIWFKKILGGYERVAEVTAEISGSGGGGVSIVGINCKFLDCRAPCTMGRICSTGIKGQVTGRVAIKVWLIEVSYAYQKEWELVKPGCL